MTANKDKLLLQESSRSSLVQLREISAFCGRQKKATLSQIHTKSHTSSIAIFTRRYKQIFAKLSHRKSHSTQNVDLQVDMPICIIGH